MTTDSSAGAKKTSRKAKTSVIGQQIIMRFYLAVNELINRKVIKGLATFTKKYDIDRRNFKLQGLEPERKQFDVGWIHYIVKDYGINLEWIMFGKGNMFKADDKMEETEAKTP